MKTINKYQKIIKIKTKATLFFVIILFMGCMKNDTIELNNSNDIFDNRSSEAMSSSVGIMNNSTKQAVTNLDSLNERELSGDIRYDNLLR